MVYLLALETSDQFPVLDEAIFATHHTLSIGHIGWRFIFRFFFRRRCLGATIRCYKLVVEATLSVSFLSKASVAVYVMNVYP